MLRLVSGVAFQVGAQYRTYNESFRLVTIKGTDAEPWFEVRNPNGGISIYGKATNSKIRKVKVLNGTEKTPYFEWAIDTETDSFGNQVYYWYGFKDEGFSYQVNKQRIFPDFIQYNGDSSIKFEYRYVNEPVDTYGLVTENGDLANYIDKYRFSRDGSHQLKKLIVKKQGYEVRTYLLNGTGQTADEIKAHGVKIGSVQECAAVEETGAQTCKAPISFDWGSPSTPDIRSVTDSAGAITKFEYKDVQGADYWDGGNYTLPVPFTMPTNPLPRGKKSSTKTVQYMYKSTALAPNDFKKTLYQYFGNGEESSIGRGFLGFRAIATIDYSTFSQYGTYLSTFKQFSKRTAHLTGSLDLVAEHVYSNWYPAADAKLISKIEYRPNVIQFDYSNGAKNFLPIVDQITNFSYELGVLTGVSTKNNIYNVDAEKNLITSIESTTVTGATTSDINFTPTEWGDNTAYQVSPTSVKSSHKKITTLESFISATDWRVGTTKKLENRFYNGVIDGSGVDSKIQFTDYTVKAGTTLVETETNFTNDPEYHLQKTYSYTQLGLPQSVTLSGIKVDLRTTTTFFSSSSTVPNSVTNTFGHTQTNSNFDGRFGLPRTMTDENGLISTQEFDAYGRVQMTMDVNGAVTTQNYLSCSTNYCDPVDGKLGAVTPSYYKEVVSHIAPTSREYYDAYGRVIRSETEGFSAGEWIRKDVQYDQFGQVYKTSLPYKVGTTPEYVVYTYDIRNRIINVQQPDGALVTTDYATAVIVTGENWSKIITTETVKKADGTSPSSDRKVSYFNAAGQLMRVINAQGTTQETTTDYEYDALGNAVKTTVNGGADGTTISTAIYDKAGNRISLTDPNAGTVTSKYTALGELREVTDAKGTITTYTYDKLGRMLTRTNSIDGTHNWYYDPVGAKGLLSSVTNNNGFTQSYFYQDANRAARLSRIETAITIPGIPGAATKTFKQSVTYDIYGRVETSVAPAELPSVGFTTTQTYNSRKYPDLLWRNYRTYPLKNITKLGAFGVEEEFLFNTKTAQNYDPKSGRISSILTTYNGNKIQDLSYQWYTNGSLQTKTDNKSGTPVVDTFTYDAHDRLTKTEASINGVVQRTQDQAYSKLGNITSNTSTNGADAQVTGYQYVSGRPHAVSNAVIKGVSTTLNYDLNGAITSYSAAGTANDKYVSYNSANQPLKITVGGSSINDVNATATEEFRYTPDGARYYKKSSYWKNGVLTTEHTLYIGSYETTYYDASSSIFQTEKTQLGDIFFVRKTPYVGSPTEILQFLHRDYLGSVTAVTNGSGGGITQLAFESFGLRRNSTTLTANISSTQLTDLFTKMDSLPSAGYTGHESLDRTGFIHMNGRVYDPQLARFLSPDPLVQSPTNSQSWNRYSYVFNNPLKYIDPTGYEGCSANADACGVKPKRGEEDCDEKCQRENGKWYWQNAEAINTQNARWEAWGGQFYNVAFFSQQMALEMAQGMALSGAMIKAGMGSKTNTNNVLGAIAIAGELGNGINWGAVADDAVRLLGRWAFVLSVASISGSTPQMHRGRIQAQGGGLEESEAWSLMKPPTAAEGLAMVERLKSRLTAKQLTERAKGFSQAERFINNAGRAGGVTAPVSRSFPQGNQIRVDIEIITGQAFVP